MAEGMKVVAVVVVVVVRPFTLRCKVTVEGCDSSSSRRPLPHLSLAARPLTKRFFSIKKGSEFLSVWERRLPLPAVVVVVVVGAAGAPAGGWEEL